MPYVSRTKEYRKLFSYVYCTIGHHEIPGISPDVDSRRDIEKSVPFFFTVEYGEVTTRQAIGINPHRPTPLQEATLTLPTHTRRVK